MHAILLRAWTGRALLACLLWPLSLLYRALFALRRLGYHCGLLRSARVGATVLVVGNVVAGGGGKTPTVIALVRHLRSQGRHVGVVSRGYGRAGKDCREVTPDATAHDCGDEALLLRRSCEVPVFVAPRRADAARALLARYPQTEIVLCDDGLQHYGLWRDLEVCVFDDRGCGNRFLLPAGPLREPWPRRALRRAGQNNARLLVLHTGMHPAFAGFRAQRTLAPYALHRDGTRVPLQALQGSPKPLLALAGIAQPEAFFAMLRAQGLVLAQTLALPDHYDFHSYNASKYAAYQLVCTEKDASKLWPLVADAVAIPMALRPEPAFLAALDAALAAAPHAGLSLPHGH